MKKKFWFCIARLGGHLWEKNGFWIDKENKVCKEDYSKLSLLGKIGYKLFKTGLKIAKVKPDEIVIEKTK